MRDKILAEIRRLAIAQGRPPGRRTFERETGIRESSWMEVFWARWGDAVKDAGFDANEWQGRIETTKLFSKTIDACRHYGRFPTSAEIRMFGKTDPSFPDLKVFSNRFGSRISWIKQLRDWIEYQADHADVLAMLPSPQLPEIEDA